MQTFLTFDTSTRALQKTTQADMENDLKAFEHKIHVDSESVSTEIELRTRELLRLRDEKQEEQQAEETRQEASSISKYHRRISTNYQQELREMTVRHKQTRFL